MNFIKSLFTTYRAWYLIAGLSALGAFNSFGSEDQIYYHAELLLFFISFGFADVMKKLSKKDD